MNITKYMVWIGTAALLITVMGCGQKKIEAGGESFGSSIVTAVPYNSTSPAPSPTASPKASLVDEQPSTVASSSSLPAAEGNATKQTIEEHPVAKQAEQPQTVAKSSSSSDKPAKGTDQKATSAVKPQQVDVQPSTKPKAPNLSNEINWSQFFDNEKQDQPSERFWDMSGKTVQIKGFMGEVLSFDKHWFLLIPKPGAECPFDNGNETYWNKIMIVFVPDSVKLRYTSGPLMITGKLDVGIKMDESGYKTMFRLYDASFEKMKE
ncbi:hypothetical protein [Paenibacillus sp. KN14-4R]|uniref:hypothetical protein n=1 Tax=Paenibacillus sp. KN14-4R TaxID=3445773 RepID=UPI003F9F5E88